MPSRVPLSSSSVFIYAWSSYKSVFESRSGFIYDPATDGLYEIRLRFTPHERAIWKPLVPFNSLRYIDPDFALFRGNAYKLLANYQADQKLFETDPEWAFKTWSNEYALSLEQDLGSYLESNPLWDVNWVFDRDNAKRSSLPPALTEWVSHETMKYSRIDVVDVLLVKFVENNDNLPITRSMNEALLLRGAIVYELHDLILGFSPSE